MAKTFPAAATLRKYYRRCQLLKGLFGIEHVMVSGIYPEDSELELIEFMVHELAHAFTAGFKQLPVHLPELITHFMEDLGHATQDSLEIDTCYVTHKVMCNLNLALQAELHTYAEKCANACDTAFFEGHVYRVLDALEDRYKDPALSNFVRYVMDVLQSPLSEVKFTYLLPSDGKSAPYRRGLGTP